jgi:lysophospholipase L1-like esterase
VLIGCDGATLRHRKPEGSMKRFHQLILSGVLMGVLTAIPASALEPGQSPPKRLYSIGDSITRAVNANLPFDNVNNSWVNGYYGFWEWLFGLPNIKSHNQRISANFGSSGRKNWIAAQNGAQTNDLVSQATGTAGRNVTYATVMLGANDVCRESFADLPADDEFKTSFSDGMDILLGNLPNGATVQVVAIPDLKRLYDIGKDKTALGIVDCEVLWATTVLGFPCGSMLSPSNSEVDRLYVQSRNIGYNRILKEVTEEKQAEHQTSGKFVSFTEVSFTYEFTETDISDIDCYHPSWRGQRTLATITWDAGPFQAYQAGN